MDDMTIAVPELISSSHRWDDVSYHGSPIWQCDFCNIYKSTSSSDYCPKAVEFRKREAKEAENKERWEYERMKAERERFAYLEAKYGK